MKKSISIFGSTGSIGKNAVSILKNDNKYDILALCGNNNVKLLIKQAKELNPKYVAIANKNLYNELKSGLTFNRNIKIFCGVEEVNELAKIRCDLFICAISGIDALKPLVSAIKAKSNIGLANKESLVSAGELIINEAKENHVKIIPIDSEHNSIFQIIKNTPLKEIEDITITASGGPFFNFSYKDLKNVKIKDALNHPNWLMGQKISIDSATMMNKALEVIESYYLFPISPKKIKVLVHPQSILHALVNYIDGSSFAALSIPDMRIPIAYAIGYPRRIKIDYKSLNLVKNKLDFFDVDNQQFPSVKLAYESLKIAKNAPCILNAVNEIAVNKFLNGEISFLEIVNLVENFLYKSEYNYLNSIEDVIECHQEVKNTFKNK